jgi:hypothetical protein
MLKAPVSIPGALSVPLLPRWRRRRVAIGAWRLPFHAPRVRALRVLARGTWQIRESGLWRSVQLERCWRAGCWMTFCLRTDAYSADQARHDRIVTVWRNRLQAEQWRALCVKVASYRPANPELTAGSANE